MCPVHTHVTHPEQIPHTTTTPKWRQAYFVYSCTVAILTTNAATKTLPLHSLPHADATGQCTVRVPTRKSFVKAYWVARQNHFSTETSRGTPGDAKRVTKILGWGTQIRKLGEGDKTI